MSVVVKRLDELRCNGYGVSPRPMRLCVRWGPSYRQKERANPPRPIFWPMSIVSKRLDGSRCHFVRK